MFKFLRKYNKFILAVGGSLLVIVFLIPQAIQQLSQQAALRSADVATVGLDNEDVSVSHWEQQIRPESQIVQTMGLSFPPLGTINDTSHWYLLTREAEQLGFVPARPTGQQFAFDEQTLRLLSGQVGGASPALIQQTLAKAEGVSRMIGTYLQSGELSDRRLQQYAQKKFHAVGLQTVVIKADADAVTTTPSEQELQAQLDTYKDVDPGDGEHGFGYKLPNRVKLEWFSVSADTVRAELEQDNDRLSGRELRRHWRDNAGQRDIPPVETGVAVPDIVREDLLDQLVAEELDQIEKFAYDQIRIPQRTLSRSDGFFELPDDWAAMQVDLQDLTKRLKDRFKINESPQLTDPDDEWIEIADLNTLDGIGSGRTDKFGRLATTPAMIVGRAKEFGGDGTIPIQKAVAGPPLRSADGSVYVFRITDTDAARAPKSVDEVRDQLVNDLRRQKHYEQLAAQTGEFEDVAKTQGMLGAALAFDGEVTTDDRAALYEPDKYFLDSIRQAGLEATPSLVPGLGDAPEILEAIIDWARTFPPDVELDTLPEAERIGVFEAEEQFAVVVVLLTKQYPVTVDDFKSLTRGGQVKVLMLGEELGDVQLIADVFGYDALAARHNFQPSRSDETDEDAETDAADESTDA